MRQNDVLICDNPTVLRNNRSVLWKLNLEERMHLVVKWQIVIYCVHRVRLDGFDKLTIQGIVEGPRSRGTSPTRYTEQS